MREHYPDRLPIFIDGWADKDPSSVFGYVSSFPGPAPCTPETLMKILKRFGTEQPESFLSKVESVPWEKFLFSKDPFGTGLSIEKKEEVNLWTENGAPKILLEQGVEIEGLFWYWSQQDSSASMQAWMEWGNPESDASISAFREILKAQLKSQERTAALNESLSQMDETSIARMKISWATLEKRRPWAADEIRESIPLLQSWSSKSTVPAP